MFACILTYAQDESVTFYFEVNESELTQQHCTTLDSLIGIEGLSIMGIEGFADSTGNSIYNRSLSLNRALSVANYFVANGLDINTNKYVRGRGESVKNPSLSKNRVVVVSYVQIVAEDEPVDLVKDEPEHVDTAENETFNHLTLTRDGELDQKTIESLNVGDILNLGGIEFIPGRHKLTKKSYKALDKLISIMKDNPGLEIEIQGHICCQVNQDGYDADTKTMNLSENRALEVYKELRTAGIDKNRLTYRGYGPFRKLVVEVDEETRQRNRRVSIQVLDK